MGEKFMDQYSLLHFATGIVIYFWGFSLKNWIIFHVLFEIIENTTFGKNIINNSLKGIWPGGKNYSDSFINIVGDNCFAIFGWMIANYVDRMGIKYKWFRSHIT